LLRFFMNLLSAKRTDGVYPEVDMAAHELFERMGHDSVQDRIAKTVRSLAAEARDMESRLSSNDGDLVPCVVGGASRVQELVIDLLAISRYAETWDNPEAEPENTSQVAGAMQFALTGLGNSETSRESDYS